MKLSRLFLVATVVALCGASAFAFAAPDMALAVVDGLRQLTAPDLVGGAALAAGPLTMAPNQALPEVIRVKAQKGFFAAVDGKFGQVNPGDVVDVPRTLAFELRASGKAHMTEEELKRQKNYVPPYARGGAAQDPVAAQLSALTAAVSALGELVAGLKPAKA